MASIFENPQNGHREEIGGLSALWAIMFGWFYFIYRGLWPHVLIQWVILAILGIGLNPAALVLAFPMWVVYALAAPSLIKSKYLRSGWRLVGDETKVAVASTTRPTGPDDVSAATRDFLRAHQGAQVSQQAPVPQPGAARSTVDDLAKLADLRDRGVLTDDEFQHQKRLILAKSR